MIDEQPDDHVEDDEPQPPPPAVDPQQQRRIRNKKKRARLAAQTFWRELLDTETGRREMWTAIFAELHPFETKFACGPNGFPQTEATWSALGEQLAGQRIFQTLQLYAPEGVALMLREHDPRFAAIADLIDG